MNASHDSGRILMLRGGALGDFVCSLPVLQCLHEEFPDASLHLAAYPRSLVLAESTGWVADTYSLDDPRFARLFSYRPDWSPAERAWWSDWSLVVNYLHDPEGTVQTNLQQGGLVRVIGADPIVSDRHAIDHLLQPLQALAVFSEELPAHLPVSGLAEEVGRQRLPGEGPWLLLQPGSGGREKNWPLERFIAVAEHAPARLGRDPVWLLGEAEREWIGDTEALPGTVLPPLEVAALPGLFAAAGLLLGNDAGTTHLAAAAGCRCVALFGPSDPNLWAPRGDHVKVLWAPDQNLQRLTLESVLEALCA